MGLKKFTSFIFLLAILAGLTNCKKTSDRLFYEKAYVKEIKQAREDLRLYLATNTVPGAEIAIYKDGKLIYSEGMGAASRELNVPVKRDTKFRIGPTSAAFTALAFRLLVENGTLHPDSSIQHYLPEFPEKEYKITLENLVQNTSGIREENINEATEVKYNYTMKSVLERIINDSLIYIPGEYQVNTVYNYDLLGTIMEKTTNKRFDKIIKELITDTLHLGNTMEDNPFNIIENRTDFYDHNLVAMVTNSVTMDLRSKAPALGLLSTAEDLAKFGNDVLHSPYISDEIRKNLFKVPELSSGVDATMANGWNVFEDYWKRKFYVSAGQVRGGGSSLLVFPDDDLVIAILINLTMDMQEIPDYKIATYFLPKNQLQIEVEAKQKEMQNNNAKESAKKPNPPQAASK